MTAHNLCAGFYLLDHTTGTVVQGPFGTRNQAVYEYRSENSPGPFVVLEVVGDVVPWLGAAVGNVCVTAETAEACPSIFDPIPPAEFAPVTKRIRKGGPPLAPSYSDRIENGDADETLADEG